MRSIYDYSNAIKEWIREGCPCEKDDTCTILQRPTARTYPNTFVLIWHKPNVGCFSKISLDVHYKGQELKEGQPLEALGGLWAKGFNAKIKDSLHPQQEFDEHLKEILLRQIGSTSPDPSLYEEYGHSSMSNQPRGKSQQHGKPQQCGKPQQHGGRAGQPWRAPAA